MTTSITSIQALPANPFPNTEFVGIVITSGVPSYYRVTGHELDKIINVAWYPTNTASVIFTVRQLMCVSPNEATFMIQVTNNFLYNNDRGGRISFKTEDGNTLSFPVITYGPVSYQSLWRPNQEGLNTG